MWRRRRSRKPREHREVPWGFDSLSLRFDDTEMEGVRLDEEHDRYSCAPTRRRGFESLSFRDRTRS